MAKKKVSDKKSSVAPKDGRRAFSALFIRKIRRELGVTQRELALRLDVTQQTVYNWEKGRTSPPMGVIPKINQIHRDIEIRVRVIDQRGKIVFDLNHGRSPRTKKKRRKRRGR